MGAYRKLYFRKKFIECLFIHAVDISTCIHSNHYMEFVGSLGVAGYGKSEVLPPHSSSVGLNMVNKFKHIYPWWIWLSDSIFVDVGVIIILGGLNKISSLFSSFLGLAYLVEMSNFMAGLTLGIPSWTLLSRLVIWFSTSHSLSLHPWGFSRLMTRIRRSLCSRIILSQILSITLFCFVALALVLSTVMCSKVY